MVWKEDLLGDICFTTSGGTPSRKNTEYYKNGTIPWVKSGELENNIIFHTEEYITQTGLDNSSAKIFPAGTLLIALYGATIGKLSFLGIDAATNQAVCGLFKNEKVSLKYLYYYLLYQRPNLVKLGVGGAQPNISQTILKKLSIPYPLAFADQELIVARIEELFSQLDSGVETMKLLRRKIDSYKFAAIENLIPYESLRTVKECILDMGQGWSPKCNKENVVDDDKWAVIKTTAVQPCSFQFEENKALPANLSPREKHEIKVGDILITRAGPKSRCGICCMVRKTKKHLLNCDKVYRIQVNNNELLPEYLEYVLNSPGFIKEINLCKTGGNDSGLNLTQDRFLSIKIPVPPIESQRKIVQRIEARMTVCKYIEQTVDTTLQQAEAMRQSILKKAFEGGF